MPGTGSHNFNLSKRFKYTGDMVGRLAEAHGKIRRQREKEEEKKLRAQLAKVQTFKRALMQCAKREAKEEAKKLKDEAKKLKDDEKAKEKTLRPKTTRKSRGWRMLNVSKEVEEEDETAVGLLSRAVLQCCAGNDAG